VNQIGFGFVIVNVFVNEFEKEFFQLSVGFDFVQKPAEGNFGFVGGFFSFFVGVVGVFFENDVVFVVIIVIFL
jgi:hypothetical protein